MGISHHIWVHYEFWHLRVRKKFQDEQNGIPAFESGIHDLNQEFAMSAAIMNSGMFSVENKMSLSLFPFFRTKERNLFLFESILFFNSFPDSEKEMEKRNLFEYEPNKPHPLRGITEWGEGQANTH